jgi:hypothetical protein
MRLRKAISCALRKPLERDLELPPFLSNNTYPVGNLLGLLPYNLLLDPLLNILERENDYNALQYAAYCIGLLNIPRASEIWREVRDRRLRLHRRKSKIGRRWPLADRQLLYSEAQLGSDRARLEHDRKLRTEDVKQFEAAYNYVYYQGNRKLMEYRFERRIDEGLRADQNVREILLRIYDETRRWLNRNGNRDLKVLPHLWSSYSRNWVMAL